jgi:hypothetical protein
MAILSELAYPGDILKLELGEQALFSRQQITLEKGQKLAAGTVLGRITAQASSSATKSGGNTGTGTLTMDSTTPVLAFAKSGVYTVRATTAAGAATVFTVTDPLGTIVGTVTSALTPGVTFANQIKFVVVSTATSFVVGDGFDVTVTNTAGAASILAPAASDGTQTAAGVLAIAVDATSNDVQTWMVARSAVLAANKIVWPGSITAAQQTTATNQLNTLGIVLRTGV